MLLGPDQVLQCPSCSAVMRQPTISAGNTIGAIYYTDGYMDAPMLPQPSALRRCPACRIPFLGREAQVLGQVDLPGVNLFPEEAAGRPPEPAWMRAPRVIGALVTDYVAVLAMRRFGRDDEIELRVELMHLCNHPRRQPPRGVTRPPLSALERANLAQLAARLDLRDPEERVMLAEVRRELSDFQRAAVALDADHPDSVALAAARIRQLAESRDPWVAEIFTGE